MKMRRLLLALALVACTKADQNADRPEPPQSPRPEPGVAFSKPPPTTTPAVVTAQPTIELTAVTLADDCGGTPPYSPPPAPTKTAKAEYEEQPKAKAKADAAYDEPPSKGARAKRRCEQTSMQLAVTSPNAGSIKVKSVELFDENGKSLGVLAASSPTRWSADQGMYEPWDEAVPAGTLVNVSYVLQQPNWAHIGDRWNRTYTLKTTITIGGVEQSAQKDVTLSAPTTLPPNVKT